MVVRFKFFRFRFIVIVWRSPYLLFKRVVVDFSVTSPNPSNSHTSGNRASIAHH